MISLSKINIILISIFTAVLVYLLFSVAQLRASLDTVSQQIQVASDNFNQAKAKSNDTESVVPENADSKLEQLIQLQQDYAQLSKQVESISAKLENLEEQTLSSSRPDPKALDIIYSNEQVQPAQTHQPQVLSQAESQAMLDHALTDATRHDPIWSDNTTLEIEQLFTHSPNFEIARDFNVTCGGQLCKIQTTLPQGVDYLAKQMFEMNMLADLSPFTSRSITNQRLLADGRIQIDHYIARKGYPLPTESSISTANDSDDAEPSQ